MVGMSSPAKVGVWFAGAGCPQSEQKRLLSERLLPHDPHFAIPRSGGCRQNRMAMIAVRGARDNRGAHAIWFFTAENPQLPNWKTQDHAATAMTSASNRARRK